MALILEIRDRNGLASFYPLAALPLSVGRGLSNDIIIGDPYLDARHLAIESDETGELTLRDLGSVNGVFDRGNRIAAPVGVVAGMELRAGRTTFRFRDRDEAMAPALVDAPRAQPAEKRSRASAATRWTVVVATLGVVGLMSWLGSYDRDYASTVLAATLAAGALLLVWAGIWGLALRGPERRVQLGAHLAIASLAVLVMMVYQTLNSWLVFLFPDVGFLGLLFDGVVLFALAAVIAGHLWIGTAMPRRQRWRAGAVASGTAFLLLALAGWSQMDKFSDTPKFPSGLKPVSPGFVPTRSVSEFVKAMSEAREDADKAMAKAKKKDDR